MDIYKVIKEPCITEKASQLKSESNQVSFKVHRSANKIEIRRAVENLLKANVLEVRTMNVLGKKRRIGRNVGKKADWKKAVVRLGKGQNIEGFDGL
ncbi:MAG: 50S ribosomal protein L23 [Deltaproteobacteria bacterium]|nr:50S ribosomal protein L23 [Deltaproteobacteria bacterium]HEN20728.1 50S ribosomal protein L23 [Desulfobacteraceae bacterium]